MLLSFIVPALERGNIDVRGVWFCEVVRLALREQSATGSALLAELPSGFKRIAVGAHGGPNQKFIFVVAIGHGFGRACLRRPAPSFEPQRCVVTRHRPTEAGAITRR